MAEFTDEADHNDVLQEAGDVALKAATAYLEHEGIDEFSIVMTIEADDRLATCLHFWSDVELADYPRRALATQLAHARLSAAGMGLRLEVFPFRGGNTG